MARNPESTKPTPSQLLHPGYTTQAGSQLESQSWEISSPFLANTFSGNAKDEHQEWPEGAATAPEVTSPFLRAPSQYAAVQLHTTNNSQDFSMH